MKIRRKKENNKILVAVTGNLCSGKSFILDLFKQEGYQVFSFDNEVRKLFQKDKEVFALIKEFFPETVINDCIDRDKLGSIVFFDKDKLEVLEGILRPKLYQNKESFIKSISGNIAFFEVPLLFEKETEYLYNFIILLKVKKSVQKQRIIKRKISFEKAEKILEKQIKSSEVESRADYIIDTSQDLSDIRKHVNKIMGILSEL